jgi:DNA-binding HxlR family transcriptional regulator
MDALSLPVNASCPIAHALDVLGEKWTLIILREALAGKTRFADFQRIGIPREVLSQRLTRLLEHGILAKRPYKEAGSRVREEYFLTDEGRDVSVVLAALGSWGQKHLSGVAHTGIEFIDRASGKALSVEFHDGEHTVGTSTVGLVRQIDSLSCGDRG